MRIGAGDPSGSQERLHVRKILIAEDDLMIADMAEEVLTNAGYEVVGIARTVDEGLALAARFEPSLALIDQRLADGGLGTNLAARLRMANRRRRTCILYATGNVAAVEALNGTGDACLAKPYRAGDLLHALQLVAEIADTGQATLPWPPGFKRIASKPAGLGDQTDG